MTCMKWMVFFFNIFLFEIKWNILIRTYWDSFQAFMPSKRIKRNICLHYNIRTIFSFMFQRFFLKPHLFFSTFRIPHRLRKVGDLSMRRLYIQHTPFTTVLVMALVRDINFALQAINSQIIEKNSVEVNGVNTFDFHESKTKIKTESKLCEIRSHSSSGWLDGGYVFMLVCAVRRNYCTKSVRIVFSCETRVKEHARSELENDGKKIGSSHRCSLLINSYSILFGWSRAKRGQIDKHNWINFE